MIRHCFLLMISLAGWSNIAHGQTSPPSDENESALNARAAEAAPASQPAAMPSIIQKLPDYTGDLAHRKYLTGDWGGARTALANKGILFDLDVTQLLQGNAHGGKDTNNAFRYSGSADYYLKLDTARMGLWPGGLLNSARRDEDRRQRQPEGRLADVAELPGPAARPGRTGNDHALRVLLHAGALGAVRAHGREGRWDIAG